ncbi:MAG: amino acid ABC transporter ATP-binding protein [Planctomycetes bacterium]|nr:amino acid ABC transporter ATP-binding protein [Planctomycetota bacterium]
MAIGELHVRISGLTKRFGERLVLDDISLEFRPGETVALLGPSGGGKSTLLRCINGLNSFDAGEIQVGPHVLRPGKNGNRAAVASVRRLFGMIFQDFQLFPHLSALQNVIEAPTRVLRLHRNIAVERGVRLLTGVGLARHLHSMPQQLSGGQKQRVAIARALAMEPRGLLCDEITSALDPELKSEVLNDLQELKGQGLTLILVTHEIGFARRATDRVVVLCDGRILEDGSPAEVLDNPRSERLRAFLQRVMV